MAVYDTVWYDRECLACAVKLMEYWSVLCLATSSGPSYVELHCGDSYAVALGRHEMMMFFWGVT